MGLKDLMKYRRADVASSPPALVQSALLPGLEALPTAVLVIERSTLGVAFANPVAESLLEMSRRQLSQMCWPDLFTNSDQLIATIDAIAAIADNRFNATHLDASLERTGR